MEMLTEKYRPSSRKEIIGNTEIIDKIFSMVENDKLTHLILEGPAGTGKTTTGIVIAKTLFKDYFNSNFLELNASDDRGINIVREQIKTFAKTIPFAANFKIILLDEADSMTEEAEHALRRIMEKYSDITRFIFCVNHVEKLIEPIRSRCEIFRFGPISVEDISTRLYYIYQFEKGHSMPFTISDPIVFHALEKIAEYSMGDMRKALNHLQLLLAQNKPLTLEMVESVKPVDYGRIIYESLAKGRYLEARKSLQEALELGYDERYIIDLIHKTYILEQLNYKIKAEAVFALAETDFRLTQGVNEMLAMDSLLLKLIKLHTNLNLGGKI